MTKLLLCSSTFCSHYSSRGCNNSEAKKELMEDDTVYVSVTSCGHEEFKPDFIDEYDFYDSDYFETMLEDEQ